MNKLDDATRIAFSQTLKEVRKDKKLSQLKLANKANLDRTFISLLERGKRGPSLNTLIVMAQALDIKTSHLVDLIEEKINFEDAAPKGNRYE